MADGKTAEQGIMQEIEKDAIALRSKYEALKARHERAIKMLHDYSDGVPRLATK